MQEGSRKNLYVIDTSSLVVAAQYYPLDRMGIYWGKIRTLVDEGRLISTSYVYYEIEQFDGTLREWARKTRNLFLAPTEEEQTEVSAIVNSYPNLVDRTASPGPADPYVIALAKVRKRQNRYADVILLNEEGKTDETYRHRNPTWKPKIPNVCGDFNITSRTVKQLIGMEQWDFPG